MLPVAASADVERIMKFEFDKNFHVSPFMPLDMQYDWRFTTPTDSLLVHMTNRVHGHRAFDATLSLSREEINSASLAKALLKFPAMTAQVVGAIYWQALRLRLKRTPFFVNPNKAMTLEAAIQPTTRKQP